MNPILRNVLAVLAGFIGGSLVNMGILMAGSSVIVPPEGVNVSDMESLKANMHLFEAKHFISPFLAHALGTLAGALIAALLATSMHRQKMAYVIGSLFLLGGIANVYLLPSPVWFAVLDLAVAYIPMAYIGFAFSLKFKPSFTA